MSAFGHISVPNQRNQPRGRYFSNVARNLNSLRITAGRGMLVSQTGSGVTISSKAKPVAGTGIRVSGTADSVVARVVSGDSVAGYDVICYPAFPSTAGRFAAKLAVLDIALGATLPEDTYLIAHLAGLQLIGGT